VPCGVPESPPLVLASPPRGDGSPGEAGIAFEATVAQGAEPDREPGEDCAAFARRAAAAKATAVAGSSRAAWCWAPTLSSHWMARRWASRTAG